MKKIAAGTVLIGLWIFSAAACIAAPQNLPHRKDVSRLVPAELDFAKDFVQRLSDSGWSIEDVKPSKFNGGFLGTNKAAWIKTDKGILEALFYDTRAEAEKIRITQTYDANSTQHNYYSYAVSVANQNRKMEGRLPVYFVHAGEILIVTYDARARQELSTFLK